MHSDFKGAFAGHFAISRGYTNAADLLLFLGSPSVDVSGRSIAKDASKSDHDFVRKWGGQIEKPLRLEQDIQTLFKLILGTKPRYGEAREHILTSKCMFPQVLKDNPLMRYS